MKKLATAIAAVVLIGTPAFAADIAVKAPPPAPALVPYTWTGFYGGIEFGGGWSGTKQVNFSPNDPAAAALFNGTLGFLGEQPLATSQGISQSGLVGGFEVGYNWQAASNWLLGFETDFSFSGMSGQASGPTSNLINGPILVTQTTNANQSTDWYGTVRGRAGWLATPNLLLFSTGGFAYGRVADSANYTINTSAVILAVAPNPVGGFSFTCFRGVPCFTGSSSTIRTGWTAGGGIEWLLAQHWSAKIEYQFVDLGTETVRVTATSLFAQPLGTTPASFNAAFHYRFNVVRLGLNYHF